MRADHMLLVLESIIQQSGPECEIRTWNKDGKLTEIQFQQQFEVDRQIIGETKIKRTGVIILPE